MDRPPRLYVVVAYHQHFVHWCYMHKVSPHLRELVELCESGWNRRLLGVHEPLYTVVSYPRDSLKLISELELRFGHGLTALEADAWIEARRKEMAP